MAYQESEMEWEEFWEWIHNLEARIAVTYNISANPYKQRAHDM